MEKDIVIKTLNEHVIYGLHLLLGTLLYIQYVSMNGSFLCVVYNMHTNDAKKQKTALYYSLGNYIFYCNKLIVLSSST
jgi:hypothetical protein